MENNFDFLRYIVTRLQQAGIACVIFGGWAEELTGAIAPRQHSDIDILYISDSFKKVDVFIKKQIDITEIPAKHFPHKRAFLCHEIMIEILLVFERDNRLFTNFWNEYELEWPGIPTTPIDYLKKPNLYACKPEVVAFYRQHWARIAEVRAKYVPASSEFSSGC
ncbi:MAG: hypothetical protein Q7S57_06165 [bacterium]|nr:hypothetical protein [bacterium]